MDFVRAANYRKTNGRTIDLVCLHSMEAPEKGDTAAATARYFASGKVVASAHYNIDSEHIVQSVRDQDVAYAAPGANNNGLHFEHAGYARQSREEWLDFYSLAILKRSAALCAEKLRSYNLPTIFVDASALKRGARGITTHYEVSQAFHQTNHTDPGPGFPIDIYLNLVRAAQGAPQSSEAKAMAVALDPVASVSRPGGGGYIVGKHGHVYAFDAPFFGGLPSSMPGKTITRDNVIGLVPTLTGNGYWIITADGEVYAYGDAEFPGVYEHDKWGRDKIIGAFVNNRIPNCGGVTLVRASDLNVYRLPA